MRSTRASALLDDSGCFAHSIEGLNQSGGFDLGIEAVEQRRALLIVPAIAEAVRIADKLGLDPVLLFTEEEASERFKRQLIALIESAIDRNQLPFPGVFFGVAQRFQNAGHAEQFGAIRAERISNAIQGIDTRFRAAATLDVAQIGAAQPGAVGQLALVDPLRGASGLDPVAERGTRRSLRLTGAPSG